MIKKTYRVKGMHCQGCENRVKRMLQKNEAIQHVEASHLKEEVEITFDETKTDESVLVKTIEQLDFKVST